MTSVAAGELGVDVVPIAVALDGVPFTGRPDTFYARMREGAVATTATPTPAEFASAYERAAAQGASGVLSLHLDRRVSGVSASAALAAREASIPVEVRDLPTASFGVGLCVRAAARVLAAGGGREEAAARAARAAAKLDNVFVARAAPGGRVPSTSNEWAVLRFADGKTTLASTHPSLEGASGAMARLIVGTGPIAVAVGYAGPEVEAGADALAHELLEQELVHAVERYRVEPSVGAHTGPDSFGAFWWPASGSG